MVSEALRLEDALRSQKGLKLVAYIMAGHPNRKRSIEVGKRLAASGIAALEIGIPHSDPLADGPVIQRAGQAALEHGMTVGGSLEVAAAIASEGIPVVLMTYINPVLAYDPRRFAAEAAQAGVAGVIVPDMPVEESEPVSGWFRAASLDTVFMVAGARKQLPAGMKDLIAEVRKHTKLPIAAGFGISRPEHLAALRGAADAAIVGSAIVDKIDKGIDPVVLVKELLKACR
jgi:tryptophan synthase alpha chain